MMYAVETIRKDTHERAETAYFDTLKKAFEYAEEVHKEGEWLIEVYATTGDSGDAGKRIDYERSMMRIESQS